MDQTQHSCGRHRNRKEMYSQLSFGECSVRSGIHKWAHPASLFYTEEIHFMQSKRVWSISVRTCSYSNHFVIKAVGVELKLYEKSSKASQLLKVLVLRFLISGCRFTVQLHSVDHLLCAVNHLQWSGGEGSREIPAWASALHQNCNKKKRKHDSLRHTLLCFYIWEDFDIDIIHFPFPSSDGNHHN